MATTLITGATGFIGSYVCRLLVDRGDEVVATVRAGSRTEELERLPVRLRVADILDRRAVRRVMQGVERVFHLAGSGDLAAERQRTFAVNVEGTRIVLEEALRAGAERVVLTSSVAAIGPAAEGTTADEQNVWDAGRYRVPYLDAAHEAEVAAMRLAARGLPLVIVNPGLVLGAGDPGRSSTAFVRSFLRRQLPMYIDGTVNIVGVDDVARGHLLADELGTLGERYILGNRNFTFDRLFADLGRLSGVEPPRLKLPLPAALALSDLGRRMQLRGMPRPGDLRAMSLRWAFTSRKAKRELGWTTSPHEDSLEATIAFYRERYGTSLAPAGSRQPLPLRFTGDALAVLRRLAP
ncbi:MAG TPA: NAD-dependent epimerase/dehydratase family protein [Solirubrobacteraceae bacterium]|jgi:dihydroflavonol-4-reductase|nr:NAD-dependent epimerase/dehydratase family protein [Solirubrobacteraceae bacterium]